MQIIMSIGLRVTFGEELVCSLWEKFPWFSQNIHPCPLQEKTQDKTNWIFFGLILEQKYRNVV